MEYTTIDRAPDAFQQPVPLDRIQAMCQRAFGQDIHILSIKELSGGSHNNTYLITLQDMPPVILRVSPAPDAPYLHSDETNLMRREHHMQPLLAPIAALMPKTLMIDFTHQLIGRDYMFQTFMPGDPWITTENELTLEEDTALYREMAEIAKTIHALSGETFGTPLTGPTFPTWHDYILDCLTRNVQALEAAQLDASDMRTLLALAQQHANLLDEITRPHLLHGDLWTFNILIQRGANAPHISAVLDSDRCTWGDPLADWSMFLLHINETENTNPKILAGVQAFWQAYGRPEPTRSTQFRENIYRGLNFGWARLELQRSRKHDRVRLTYDRLREILATLHHTIL